MIVSLAAARVNAELTQVEAARAVDVTESTLISWEKGRKEPPFGKLLALCDLYGCTPNDIRWDR